MATLSQPLTMFEHDAHKAAYTQCLKTYESLMAKWYSQLSTTDSVDMTHPTFTTAEFHQRKQFQTWIKAVTACDLTSDAFMSIVVPTPSTTVVTTDRCNEVYENDSEDEHNEEADDESDEESDVDAEELALRAQRRQSRYNAFIAEEAEQAKCKPITVNDPTDECHLRKTEAWVWHPAPPKKDADPELLTNGLYPSILIHPAPFEEAEVPTCTLAWTPIQNARNLCVPLAYTSSFVINSPEYHPACPGDEHPETEGCCNGCVLTQLCDLPIDCQRRLGMHGGIFQQGVKKHKQPEDPKEYIPDEHFQESICLCDEWKAMACEGRTLEEVVWWGVSNQNSVQWVGFDCTSAAPVEEDDSDDSELGPRTPPMQLASCLPTSPSKRWSELEDDDEEDLPDLGDWS